MNQITNCPDDIKPWIWLDILTYADSRRTDPGFITTADMQARFGLEDKETARKYMQRLVSHADWEPTEAITPRKPGRPQATIAPIRQRL